MTLVYKVRSDGTRAYHAGCGEFAEAGYAKSYVTREAARLAIVSITKMGDSSKLRIETT
jgi:hypothetical protein